MPQLTLNRNKTAQLYDVAMRSKRKKIFVAKDQGAYVGAYHTQEDRVLFYFQGCNPDKDKDWWDCCCNMFGGDDFSVEFDANRIIELLDDKTFNGMIFKVKRYGESIEIVTRHKRPRR